MWGKLRLVLCVLVLVWSPVCFGAGGYLITEDELAELETLQSRSAKTIERLQQLVNESKLSLAERSKIIESLQSQTKADQLRLESLGAKLHRIESVSLEQLEQLASLRVTMNELEKSLRKLEREVRWLRIKVWVAGIGGVLVGLAI